MEQLRLPDFTLLPLLQRMAWLQQQQQLILRLPEPLAKVSRRILYKDKGKNSTSVSVRPQDSASPSNDFIFTLNGQDYPALLMNLPTPVETHKTFDSKIFLKSGDIGQVFETEEQREAMRVSTCHTIHGDYMPSGLTPPTVDIVKRRFEQTRKNEGNFIPYRIRNVAQEMSGFGSGTGKMVNATTGEHITDSNVNAPGPVLEVVSETVTEEVMDFEEWMVDQAAVAQGRRQGVSITLHGSQLGSLRDLQGATSEQARSLLLLLQHPELLVTEEDREEDDIDALAAEQAREQRARVQLESAAGSAAMEVDAGDGSGPGPVAGAATAGSSSSGSGSAPRAAQPLKLSLSMLRTGASAAAGGASKDLEDSDEAMVQDEVGDTGNGEEEGEDGNVSENEAEDDGEDGEGEDDEGDEALEGEDGIQLGTGVDGAEAYYGVPAAWQLQQEQQQQQQFLQMQQSAALAVAMVEGSAEEAEPGADAEAAEEGAGQEEGAVGGVARGDDESSVNSDDSDAWMREV